MNEPSHQEQPQRRSRNCNPELRRDHDRAYRERNAERIKELRKNWNSRYYARRQGAAQGDEMRTRHCTNCGQTFTPQPGRPEQEYCRNPCTPRLVMERERAEAAAAQREREREGAQPQVRSAYYRRLQRVI